MPSPTTALQLIRDGLGLTNAVGNDLTLTADETADGLRVLNDLIENWSLQNLAVWGQSTQTFNTISTQAVYTIGVSGADWLSIARPVNINPIAYAVINQVTFPCEKITQEQYDLIAYKGQTQEYPIYFLFVNDDPLGKVTLWPVPNAVTPITFDIDRVLVAVAAAGTILSFPPGYAKAFKYALAVELSAEFGTNIADYPMVSKIAADSMGDIKRANRNRQVMRFGAEWDQSNRWWGYGWRGWY